MSEQSSMSNREVVAATVSGAIVLGALIYWVVQIDGVIETLKLAAGG